MVKAPSPQSRPYFRRYCKYVKRLLGIRAAGDHCVLAANGDDAGQYVVVLCDAIGSPLETRYIDVEPLFVTMTQVRIPSSANHLSTF